MWLEGVIRDSLDQKGSQCGGYGAQLTERMKKKSGTIGYFYSTLTPALLRAMDLLWAEQYTQYHSYCHEN